MNALAPVGIHIVDELFLPGPRYIRRAMDMAISLLVGLLRLLPFVIAIAVLIKLSSPGPVFYGQERLGRNGIKFKA